MAQLLVRNIESAVVRKLRERAAKEGVSVEEAHRRLLRETLLGEKPKPKMNFKEFLLTFPDVDVEFPRIKGKMREVEF